MSITSWKSSIKDGEYKRKNSQFRNWITPDGSNGPTGSGGFLAEKDRYHLYVSLACPWAHRTLVFRKLKNLEDYITVNVVHPVMLDKGWTFQHDQESSELFGTTGDELYQSSYLSERYFDANPNYIGNITVPVLWDKKTKTIVNNESSEIIRMFNSSFDELTKNTKDYYPELRREAIDKVNDFIYNNINNGVYKTGFATTQSVYTRNVTTLFAALDKVEELLSNSNYLVGDQITEADWRLWTTLIRFDYVYHTHFKCNIRLLQSYKNIYEYMLNLYQIPGIAETVNIPHIKTHYYASHLSINPFGIVPLGHHQDWSIKNNRK